MGFDMTVERDDEGRYVEIEGSRYRGDDLPAEGTWIMRASIMTTFGGTQEADIEWGGDTPSGTCRGTVRKSWG